MASFPPSILDEDEARAVRLVALALLADAAAHRERLTQPGDPEALHDFRVAVRRLRSWLRAHGGTLARSAPKRAQKWLRRLAGATNHSRDAEVFLGWLAAEKGALTDRQRVGAAWLLKRLGAQKSAADAEVVVEVARDFERARELLEERLPHFELRMHVHDGARVTTFAAAMATLVRSHAASLRRRLHRELEERRPALLERDRRVVHPGHTPAHQPTDVRLVPNHRHRCIWRLRRQPGEQFTRVPVGAQRLHRLDVLHPVLGGEDACRLLRAHQRRRRQTVDVRRRAAQPLGVAAHAPLAKCGERALVVVRASLGVGVAVLGDRVADYEQVHGHSPEVERNCRAEM